MKKIFLTICILSTIFSACKDDGNDSDPVDETYTGLKFTQNGTLSISLAHKFNAAELLLGKDYVTPQNDTVNFSKFKYYISNVSLQNAAGNWVNLGNYNLVDLVVPSKHNISLNNVPAGNYVKLSFLLGVDSTENFSGTNTGDLDPSYGMYWTWATGYVFFRLSGRYNGNNSMTFDLGGNQNLPKIELDLSSFKASGTSINLSTEFNLADIFSSPHNYKLNSATDDMHTATYAGAPLLRDNLQIGCFKITAAK
jgi:hypothetical protein